MSTSETNALQTSVISFVRSFGLLDRERTPCGLDLHISEAHLLGDLSNDGPTGQKQLGERLNLSKSTVSRLVSQLINRGWLERSPDAVDGRAVLVSLTDAGGQVADRLHRSRSRRFDDLLAALPDQHRATTIEGMHHLAIAARAGRLAVMS